MCDEYYSLARSDSQLNNIILYLLYDSFLLVERHSIRLSEVQEEASSSSIYQHLVMSK
jgi:hypothetical protein